MLPLPPMPYQRMIADLACSFEEDGKILRKLSDLNLSLIREVVTRAISAAVDGIAVGPPGPVEGRIDWNDDQGRTLKELQERSVSPTSAD